MDDLNRKRLEKGQPLSTHGKDEDQLNEMLVEAVKARGYNGRTYSGPQENPVGPYRLSRWLPFGAHPDYEAPTRVAKLMGYELVATQRDDKWFFLYFDADADRGGALRRVDLWEDEVVGICRSDMLEGGIVEPISKFTTVRGQKLTGLEAFCSGRLVLHFESTDVALKWDCPLDADKKPEGRDVVYERGKANFERVLLATGR